MDPGLSSPYLIIYLSAFIFFKSKCILEKRMLVIMYNWSTSVNLFYNVVKCCSHLQFMIEKGELRNAEILLKFIVKFIVLVSTALQGDLWSFKKKIDLNLLSWSITPHSFWLVVVVCWVLSGSHFGNDT